MSVLEGLLCLPDNSKQEKFKTGYANLLIISFIVGISRNKDEQTNFIA